MKKIFLAIAILAIAVSAYAADTYTKVTKDNSVSNVAVVEVRRDIPKTVTSMLTLSRIDSFIADWQRKIDEAEAKIAEWEAIRVLVEVEAKKVVLKDKP